MQKTSSKQNSIPQNHYLAIGPCRLKIKKNTFRNLPTSALKEAAFIDGGLSHLKKLSEYLPNLAHIWSKNPLSYGDGDSANTPMTYLKKSQELSDLRFYLDKKLKQKKGGIYYLFGFLGKRIDHHLLNVGEISQFIFQMHKKKCTSIVIVDQQMIYLPPGNYKLNLRGIFSFMATEDAKVKMKGECKFKILKNEKIQKMSSKGLSNTGFGIVQIFSDKSFILITQKSQSFLTEGIS
ncbi:MAG: hypothetical protein HOP07_02835 [Bacteriovoracaceae bacterium]|nr:hypothetical protein [Bacteriovoracaceae bacterium]